MNDLKDWWPVLVGILLAGLWLGSLNARVTQLEKLHSYEHGSYDLPKGP